jgi:hypothetical protein
MRSLRDWYITRNVARTMKTTSSSMKVTLSALATLVLVLGMASCATRAGTGAAAGAGTGAVLGGPAGAAVGAGVGAVGGAVMDETSTPRRVTVR